MQQQEQSKPPVFSYELKPAVCCFTWKDYSNASAEAIGVFLLASFGTAIIGHVFGEDVQGFELVFLVANLYIVPLFLGCWQFQRTLKKIRRISASVSEKPLVDHASDRNPKRTSDWKENGVR